MNYVIRCEPDNICVKVLLCCYGNAIFFVTITQNLKYESLEFCRWFVKTVRLVKGGQTYYITLHHRLPWGMYLGKYNNYSFLHYSVCAQTDILHKNDSSTFSTGGMARRQNLDLFFNKSLQ